MSSTSPLPPDPYEALGVSKDCDVDAVRKAHRKLVLKHHPDRIKDPALVEQGKNEFQKVQQAYELLIDPARRQRYDDEVRLAQLRRERMMSEPPPRPTFTKTTYTARPQPAPTNPVQREYKSEPRYAYEEREPESPYVQTSSRGFDDAPIPRANARKVDSKIDPSERRTSTAKPAAQKEKSKTNSREKNIQATMRMAFTMRAATQTLKSKVKEKETQKEKEKELREKNAKARDKEEQRARDLKNTFTREPLPYAEDYSDDESSGSDSSTVIESQRDSRRERGPVNNVRRDLTPEPPRTKRQPSPRADPRGFRQPSPRPTPKASRQASPRPEPRSSRKPSPRPDQRSSYDKDDDDSHDEDKYERQIRSARGYQHSAMQKEQRPPLSRQGSGVRDFRPADGGRDRKSGSDSDKQRPTSSSKAHRRSVQEETRPRPSLQTQASEPVNVRAAASTVGRDAFTKPRSRQHSYASSDHRREMPELKRAGSEPMPKAPVKRDSVPLKGSALKSEVNHDSGYGSSSNPQTPENRGESPQRESRPREVSTKYRVGKEEDALRARRMGTAEPSQYLSPPEQNHHGHHHSQHHYRADSRERRSSRSRERDSDDLHRSSSNRRGYFERRGSVSRNESGSRYEEQSPRNVRTDRSPDRSAFRKLDPQASVRQSRPKAPVYASYSTNYPKYSMEEQSSPAFVRRRPSVY